MAKEGAVRPKVIIVGAGSSGLTVSACLSLRGVPSLILERNDCVGSMWRKRAYDRLTLRFPKHANALPHAPHPAAAPTYLPRDDFADYLDGYIARFRVRVRSRLRREVRAARFDTGRRRWDVEAVDVGTGEAERLAARFLVVATGTNDDKFVPELHILTKWILNLGVMLGFYLPIWMIDKLVLLLCYLVFGDTSKHGIKRPAIGPFARKEQTAAIPVTDVGTYKKIKSGEIQVISTDMTSVHGNAVEFANGRRHPFDAIVFATGYRSGIKRWLQDASELIGDDELLKQHSPKAENGLYYAGLSGTGIYGSSMDSEFIATDISKQLQPVPQAQGKPQH